MCSLFYNLGKKVGPKVRKGKWMWQNMTGTEADTIAAEYEVGKDLALEVAVQVEMDDDERTAELLGKVGDKLKRCVAKKERSFRFYAIKQDGANAFALPGGFIFITRGILELCNWDESEVAFILGHEMGHVLKGHAMDRILSNSAISVVSRAVPGRGAVGGWLKRVGIKYLESAYSQENEFEADRVGVKFLQAGEYDINGAERLLARLGEMTKQQGRKLEELGV